MKNMKKKAVKAVAVPAPVANTAITDAQVAGQLKAQYAVVVESEKTCFRERVKFGVMLVEWERFLGESRGGAGGTSDGEGLKGWLAANCPELPYFTAMGYKTMATRALKMLGGGAMATAALLGESAARQPDGAVIDVTPDQQERCDKFFAAVDSRRKLEQMWFSFSEGERRMENKRKAAREAVGKGLSDSDSATVMWQGAISVFERHRAAFHSSARDLKVPVAKKFLAELQMLVEALQERINGEG